MDIEEHYGLLLGINSPWEISLVDLSLDSQQVDIHIEYADNEGYCPKHDDRNSRTWRHLDTMQFSTLLHCQLCRVFVVKHTE